MMTKGELFRIGLVVAAVIATVAGCEQTMEWPFDSAEARRRQVETAERLGVPKDLTLDCGNGISMKLALIPAGEFVMGSPSTESGRYSSEGPQHRVWISKPFYLGVYEITQDQYKAATGDNPSHFKDTGGSAPVEQVSWDDASSFCRKLSERTGRRVRLPTEAQWEYACRAGTETSLNSGRALTSTDGACRNLDAVGWYYENSFYHTHAVGGKPANAFGLYDMHGNVYEWCSDWYDNYANVKAVDPPGSSSGTRRVLRGGTWNFSAWHCRSANRNWCTPDRRYDNIGFRVVVDLK